jgi:hypothetical protein
MKYGFGDVAAADTASRFAAPFAAADTASRFAAADDDFELLAPESHDLFAPASPHDFNYNALFANVHNPRGAEALYGDPFYLQGHGAAADPFHDFQGLQRKEKEMTEVAGPASTAASAGVKLDSGFVVQNGFIEPTQTPFTNLDDPDDPDDPPPELSGGKHKRRYTKRQQNNRRRTKKNKKMTKRKTNKKNK